jgi:hypothetical protein
LRTSYVIYFFGSLVGLYFSSWHRLIWWIYPRGCSMKQLYTV